MGSAIALGTYLQLAVRVIVALGAGLGAWACVEVAGAPPTDRLDRAVVEGIQDAGEVRCRTDDRKIVLEGLDPALRLRPGTEVFVRRTEDGGEALAGVGRGRLIGLLGGLSVFGLILIAGRQAVGALAALALVVPMLLGIGEHGMRGGGNPAFWLGLTAVVGVLVMSVAANGPKLGACVSTAALGGLAVIGVGAWLLTGVLRLHGVHWSVTEDLWSRGSAGGLDFRGLLIGGMIISGVGVCVDLAQAVASAVVKVREAAPGSSRSALWRSGMRVGRDVLGTEINSLVFAFLGWHAGNVVLIFATPDVERYSVSLIQTMNRPGLAVEAANMVCGTIGLMATIPIAAWMISRWLGSREERNTPSADEIAQPNSEGSRQQPCAAVFLRRWGWVAAFPVLIAGAAVADRARSKWTHDFGTDPAGRGRKLIRARVLQKDPVLSMWDDLRGRLEGETVVKTRCAVTAGELAGREMLIPCPVTGKPSNDVLPELGDEVLVSLRVEEGVANFSVLMCIARDGAMLWGLCAVALVAFAVGGTQGIRAVAALVVSSALVLGAFWLALTRGQPILPCLLAAGALGTGAAVLVIFGPGRKAAAVTVGVAASLLVGAGLVLWGLDAGCFTGLDTDEMVAARLFTSGREIDFRAMFGAGILLGCLGVSMDVATAVASAVSEVRLAGVSGFRGLFRAGWHQGASIAGPMVTTLVFAYMGLNVALFFLAASSAGEPMALVLHGDRIAGELLRVFVGAVAVLAAVPATGLAAALLESRARVAADPRGNA